jgi:hypothetical protein
MYEMEVTADLGFSMSQQTKAYRDQVAVRFCQALTLAELNALQGKALDGASDDHASDDQQRAETAE